MADPPRDPLPMPATMGKVAPRELADAGYTDLRQLTSVTARELLAIHGVGPKAVRILREALAAEGLAFRDEVVAS
jgi:predicted flap endonuclease-1-like 5' DNA nuclease